MNSIDAAAAISRIAAPEFPWWGRVLICAVTAGIFAGAAYVLWRAWRSR